jgi:hypothetical protein
MLSLAVSLPLREEYAGLFARLPAGSCDLERFTNGNAHCAVESFLTKVMNVCKDA